MATLATALVVVFWPSPVRGQNEGARPFKLADVSWIAGDWQALSGGGRQVDEHWTAPAGGAMMGLSRTVAGGKMIEFEYLRIVERPDGLVYVSHPNARTPGTEFKLTRLANGQAVFENPQHDFPKRIIYRKNADGSITASIDGGEGTRGPSWEYKPIRK